MFSDLFNRRTKSTLNLKEFFANKMPFLIQVAGTNGKGSTCSYLESVLMEKYKVGKFSSPHLITPLERITINNENISFDRFKTYYEKFKKYDFSFFEFCFIIAMNYFQEEKVDIAIIEVGIGARLDCTSILDYDIALITNVSYDHTELLGNSLEKIAYEKSFVAKNNTKCFYTDPILKEFVEKLSNNTKYIEKCEKFLLPIKGDAQKKNFALAYEVFKIFNISDEVITKGLKNFKLRGRQEFIAKNVLIDVSHNEDSIKELISNIKEYKNVHIHLSVLLDKDLKKIYNLLKKENYSISVYPLNDKRGRSIENIKSVLKDADIRTEFHIYEDCLNVFCGSFYFISEVLKWWH